MINLTPDSFLFLVNCMYFPADIVEIDSKKLEAIFNTIITQKSLAIPRKLNPLEAKTFLADLKFFEESDLDLLENTMNTKLKHIEARNSSLYSKLRKIIFPKIYPAIHPDEKEGILKDSLFTSDAQEEHLSFLKYLHHKEIAQIKQAKPIFRFADEEEKENAVHYCCVCNNGDYNEGDNLIYCSECLISVHMGCYGIVDSVPDNWMCNACKVMLKEDVQNLECALCPVKGGAMKISDAKWEQVSKLRGKESHSLFSASTSINTPSDLSLAKVDYSDTVNNFSWVHLSCALWNPEIDIGNFLMKEEIKNIPLLDKKKFKDYCNICKLRNYGPTFKCKHESCTFKAHIECARLNKYCMEIMNVKGTVRILFNLS